MNDPALLILLVIAIAIGFFLGRRPRWRLPGRAARIPFNNIPFNKEYFQGLNYLLNEQADKAVDAFVGSLAVNGDTLETHLALGKLMRKQGQVDRAIRIHQNLLARPSLDEPHQHQVHLELARDFMAAGLLDRAEMLLKEVIAESALLRPEAQRYLLDIFQDEREWTEAIEIADALASNKALRGNPELRRELTRMAAHFHCELAVECHKRGELRAAQGWLEKAVSVDRNCVRASILIGRIENGQGRPKQAARAFLRVAEQNPARLGECLEDLFEAYVEADETTGFDSFYDFMTTHIEQHPSTTAALFVVDKLLERAAQEPERIDQAHSLLSSYLAEHPSLAGLSKLIALRLPGLQGELAHDVASLHALVEQLMAERRLYACNHCGFSGRQLHWRCPSCKQWDVIERVRGIDAD